MKEEELQLNKGTPQVCQVAFCPEDGIPLHEVAIADGFAWCAECEKLYRVVIKNGRVSVREDDEHDENTSFIRRWVRRMRYSPRRR